MDIASYGVLDEDAVNETVDSALTHTVKYFDSIMKYHRRFGEEVELVSNTLDDLGGYLKVVDAEDEHFKARGLIRASMLKLRK